MSWTLLTSLRQVTGTLKGYDALMNLVLDEVQEVMRGKHSTVSKHTTE